MNQTIRKRIEDIKNGIVPEGYKKTKVGIVPFGWEILSFKDVTQKTGMRGSKLEIETLPICSINNRVGFCRQDEQFENEGYSNTSKELYVTVKKGEFAYNPARINVGSIGLLKKEEKALISSLYVCFKFNPKQYNSYFEYYFKTHRFNFDVNNYTEGSVRQYLFYDNFSRIRVAIPSTKEQERMAEILETQDKVIKLKEKLIEQKKQQKKYLMQQLLTGKKRLPGFTGEWGKYKFNDLFNTIPAKNFQIQKNDYLEVGQYPVVDQGKVRIIGFSNNKEKLLKVPFGGVIVFGDHTREVKYINFDFVVGADGTQILFEKDQNISFTKYLYYVLSNKHIQNDGYSRHFKYVKEFNYKIPNIKEQQAIIDILSQADKEIELLQKDLEEEIHKKKALMQLLLTGIVRVC